MPLARPPGGRVPRRYRRRAGAAPADPRCGSRPERGHRCSRYAAAVGNGRARGRPGGRPGDRSLPAPDSRPGDGAGRRSRCSPSRAILSPWPVLVAVPPRGQRADQAHRAIQGLGLRVCPHTLGHRTAWGDASALGLTVGEYQPAGCAAAELRRVVEWITLPRRAATTAGGVRCRSPYLILSRPWHSPRGGAPGGQSSPTRTVLPA